MFKKQKAVWGKLNRRNEAGKKLCQTFAVFYTSGKGRTVNVLQWRFVWQVWSAANFSFLCYRYAYLLTLLPALKSLPWPLPVVPPLCTSPIIYPSTDDVLVLLALCQVVISSLGWARVLLPKGKPMATCGRRSGETCSFSSPTEVEYSQVGVEYSHTSPIALGILRICRVLQIHCTAQGPHFSFMSL